MSRSRQRASSSSVRCPVALAARRSAGTRRTSASMRLHPVERVPPRSPAPALRTFSPNPIATHSAAAPRHRASIKHAGELAPADVQIVRPLHADRLRRQSRRAPRPRTSPQRSESTSSARRVGRALDQREPHAGAGGDVQRRPWRPRPAVCSSARTSVPGRRRRRRCRARRRASSVTDAYSSTRGTPSSAASSRGGMTVVADRRALSEGRQGRTRPRGRCGTSRTARSRAS